MRRFCFFKTAVAILLVGILIVGNTFLPAFADDSLNSNDFDNNLPDTGNSGNNSATAIHKPEFQLTRNSQLGSFQAGKSHRLTLPIKNISNHSAYNIKLELIPKKEEEKIFSSRDFVIRNVTVRPGNEFDFELPFTLNEAATQAVYDMDIKLTFSNIHKNTFVQTIPVSMYVENNNMAPAIAVIETGTEREIVDSESPQTLTVKVKNVGQLRARNITMTLEGFDQKGLYLVDDVNIRKIANLAPGMTQTLSFNVITNPDIKDNVELSAVFKYVDLMEKAQERTDKFLVPCVEKKESINNYSSIVQMNFSASEYSIQGEGEATANLTVKNNGEKDLKNLKLTLSTEAGLKLMSKYIDLIDVLKAGETKTFSYKLKSADPSADGSFPLTATLVFEEEDLVKKEGTEPVEPKSIIQVAGVVTHKKPEKKDEEDKGGNKPKIIIADYKYSGEKILAGKEFDLTIYVKNTSSYLGVKNVKITHSSETDIFIPIDAANSFYIENIAPGETVSKTIKLTSKPDAEAKMYKVTFTAEYEDQDGKSYDEKGNPFKSEESLALNLSQQIRLEVADIKIAEGGMVGEQLPIEVEFYNMGKAKLYNMVVKMDGEFGADVTNYFVGNFESSKSDMFSSVITPTEAGELKGKLVFSFEDEVGNKEEVVKEFSSTISEGMSGMDGENGGMMPEGEMPAFDENGNPIMPQEEGGLDFGMIAAILAVIIILIVAGVIFLKKRKAAKLDKILLENDDNENN